MNYLVVIEAGESSFGAFVPDLSGCVAIGRSREEVTTLIQEAIELHVDDLRQAGLPIPVPTSSGAVVGVNG